MGFSSPMAQGGQTFVHKMRMMRQITRTAINCGLLVGFIAFCFKIYHIPALCYRALFYQLKGWAISCFSAQPQIDIASRDWSAMTRYVPQGETCTVTYKQLLLATNPYVQHLQDQYLAGLSSSLYYGIGGLLLCLAYFTFRGARDRRKIHLSGQKVCTPRALAWHLKFKRKASELKLGELPLLKDAETQHMLISGTTGSGKTNCFNHLLPQIRERGQKALIVDTTGDFVSRYYDPSKDTLLNPLDARSATWHPWAECEESYHYRELAKNFIPQTTGEPFWSEAARTIFTSVLQKMAEEQDHSISSALEALLRTPLPKLYQYLKDTDAAALLDPSSDKTAASIRATVSNCLECLSYLEETDDPFSIRNWVRDEEEKGWLFLCMTPEQRAALRPLISSWTAIATQSLLGCAPSRDRRLWFILDELPSLQQLNDLPMCLSESRKYGGCAVLGLQNLPQLDELYGTAITKTIIDLCSTKVALRQSSHEVALRISNSFGEQEVKEVQEGISYGANEVRDGVNLSLQTKNKPAVSPTQLLSLDDLEAFIKLPGSLPIAKLKLDYLDIPVCNPSFESKEKVKAN